MIWIVLAIIVVGWWIVNTIKNSVWEANATPEQKARKYKIQQQVNAKMAVRALCLLILKMKVDGGKTDKQVAANPKVQRKALEAGIDISNETAIRDIKRHPDFLVYNNLLEKFKGMVVNGDSDEKIAKKLGRTSGTNWYGLKIYEADDIAFMRETILGQSAINKVEAGTEI